MRRDALASLLLTAACSAQITQGAGNDGAAADGPTTPDGAAADATMDADGAARADAVAPASCGLDEINARDFGAIGDGATDDTAAIQAAVDHVFALGGGTVCVPDGVYLVDPDVSVKPKSNTTLSLATDATLKSIPTASDWSELLDIRDVSDVAVRGGRIVGERYEHLTDHGEWCHGIAIRGSNHVRVSGITIADFWGDAVYVGSTPAQSFSSDVVIEDVFLDNSRRNNISVVSAKSLVLRNSVLTNANGTPPEAGLDLEPNTNTEWMQDVLIEGIHVSDNALYGGQIHWANLVGTANPVDVTIRDFIAPTSTSRAFSFNAFGVGTITYSNIFGHIAWPSQPEVLIAE